MRAPIITAILFAASTQALALDIVSRADWGARPAIEKRTPKVREKRKGKRRIAAENVMPRMGEARFLTVHHTGRPSRRKPLARNLRSFQSQMFDYRIDYGNGRDKRIYLGDIPYHYFIDHAGTIAQGREPRFAAYSNTRYKTPIEQHVTVVVDGNFQRQKPTKKQVDALTALLEHLSVKHGIPLENIAGHKDVAQTSCPGKHLEAMLPKIVATIAARR